MKTTEEKAIFNWRVHILAAVLTVAAEYVGIFKFKVGPGAIVLLPMLYALVVGAFTGPRFLRLVSQEDMEQAGCLIGVTLFLLMARYGTLVGPNILTVLKAGPALILQEFGNLGTIFIGVPVAVMLGLGRETVGAAYSIAREPNIALIGDVYGLDTPEGRGVMGVYICGTLFGTIFFGFLATFCAVAIPFFHPQSLALASGMGSASMMTASVGTISGMFPTMGDDLLALGAASNMLSGLDGIYMSLLLGLPLANWLYRVCSRENKG